MLDLSYDVVSEVSDDTTVQRGKLLDTRGAVRLEQRFRARPALPDRAEHLRAIDPRPRDVPPRATRVADGLRPMNDQRPHLSACSTDSRRNALSDRSPPASRAKAATGVVRSASSSRQTGTTVYSAAKAAKSSREGPLTAERRRWS